MAGFVMNIIKKIDGIFTTRPFGRGIMGKADLRDPLPNRSVWKTPSGGFLKVQDSFFPQEPVTERACSDELKP